MGKRPACSRGLRDSLPEGDRNAAEQRLRPGNVIALREVDADFHQQFEHVGGLDLLGDGGNAERPADLNDRAHDAAVDGIRADVGR
jgi:hypothetical protein